MKALAKDVNHRGALGKLTGILLGGCLPPLPRSRTPQLQDVRARRADQQVATAANKSGNKFAKAMALAEDEVELQGALRDLQANFFSASNSATISTLVPCVSSKQSGTGS